MSRAEHAFLINTPLQRGGVRCCMDGNRFNGFAQGVETVETVGDASASSPTPLQRGVNEIRRVPERPSMKYAA